MLRPIPALLVLATALGCGAPGPRVSPAPPTPPDARRLPLLGGHLTIPIAESWTGDVEHAGTGGAIVESAVALEPPDTDGAFAFPRFQLTVQELHRRTSGDVMADARQIFREDWELDPAPDPSGRIAWVLGDARPWNGEVPFLVLGALVALDDGLLVRVTFRVATDVPPAERPAYADRSRRIVPRARRLRSTPSPRHSG